MKKTFTATEHHFFPTVTSFCCLSYPNENSKLGYVIQDLNGSVYRTLNLHIFKLAKNNYHHADELILLIS